MVDAGCLYPLALSNFVKLMVLLRGQYCKRDALSLSLVPGMIRREQQALGSTLSSRRRLMRRGGLYIPTAATRSFCREGNSSLSPE